MRRPREHQVVQRIAMKKEQRWIVSARSGRRACQRSAAGRRIRERNVQAAARLAHAMAAPFGVRLAAPLQTGDATRSNDSAGSGHDGTQRGSAMHAAIAAHAAMCTASRTVAGGCSRL